MGEDSLNSGIDTERARYERLNRVAPPIYAPGQETSKAPVSLSDGAKVTDNTPQKVETVIDLSNHFEKDAERVSYNDIFGASTVGYNSWNTYGFNTGNTLGPSWNGVVQPYQRQQSGFTYEKAEDIALKAGKGLLSIFSSISKTTPLFWYKYCGSIMKVGMGLLGLSILMWVLKIGNAFSVLITSIVLTTGGLGFAMLLKDTASKYSSEYKEIKPFPENGGNCDNNTASTVPQSVLSGLSVAGLDDFEIDDNEDADDEEYEDDFEIDLDNLVIKPSIRKENPEEVLQNMPEIPQGMYTRKYLYDMFTRLLPNICPDFSTLKEITTEDRAFYEMEAAVQEATEVTGCKDIIEVIKLYENYATIIVTTSRPTGLKMDMVASELANIYAHRSNDIQSEEARSRVYAKAEAVGKTCIFTIFTGKTEMISLKDMYEQVEDYILDSNNYLPVVFGIDSMAKVIKYDLKNLESIIISGMPRSGKSWFAQNMITQMSAFTSPKELEFYICDPKGEISDFKSFCLPHVRRFVTSDDDIMETLRWLVKVEAPRRKKIIGAGDNLTSSQNIWDFKDRYPDVELSIIYVVIDEVVTLASRMDKDTYSEFRSMLRELISQLPALGIRAILMPHVLKNDIIEKKTSDLVLCRISVCGDPEHVESVTGAKSKDFPFKLTMPGDMGVRMPPVSQSIMYLRAPVLNKTNPENRELFDYMRRVWAKLEPVTADNSVSERVVEDKTAEDYALDDDDIADLDIFEDVSKISMEFRRAIGAL